MANDYIEPDIYRSIVKKMPIPSVDLVVECDDGFVLGKRENRPAKGSWFVPGGRIKKGEELDEAAHRIAQEEIGVDVKIKTELGSYTHIYPDSEFDEVSKHYVTTAYVVRVVEDGFSTDDQHSELEVFQSLPENTHKYTVKYFEDAEERSYISLGK